MFTNLPVRRGCVTTTRYSFFAMSYTVKLWCGCRVYVCCHPVTRLAYTRVVETRGETCPMRRHETGARLWLWDFLPGSGGTQRPGAEDEQQDSC